MKGMGDVPAWNDAREDVVDGDVVDDSDVLTYANWVELTVMVITCPYLLAGVSSCPRKCVEATCNLTVWYLETL